MMSSPDGGAPVPGEIAEFQGLYGSYHISELLLQKLWLRGNFDTRRATTFEGEELRILHPGRWNRLGGPDFLHARLLIGNREVTGDVEVHFRADGWHQHGHDADPAYDGVVLHVVLFPPAGGRSQMKTSAGRTIPVLVLVDLLWHDLEEYATDDAVAALNGVDPLPVVERLLALDVEKRAAELRAAALRRWRQKIHFAGLRIERLGWNEACHQTALEILGYRNNRPAMLRVGSVFSHARWCTKAPAVDEMLEAASSYWRSQGGRPANHPRRRLLQYEAWMKERPNWPEVLRQVQLPQLPRDESADDPVVVRRTVGFVALRAEMARKLCGGAVTGTRWDTLMGNLFFPFLAVARGAGPGSAALAQIWQAWYPGDVPDSLLKAVRELDPARLVCNGAIQGLLGLQLAGGSNR